MPGTEELEFKRNPPKMKCTVHRILSLADSRAAKNIPKGHDCNFEDTDAMSMDLLQREISNISIYPFSLCEINIFL